MRQDDELWLARWVAGLAAGICFFGLLAFACDFGPRGEDGWQEDERVYERQDHVGAWEESSAVGWQEHGQSAGGFSAGPNWYANLEFGSEDGDALGYEGEEWRYDDARWVYSLTYKHMILSPDGGSLLQMVPVPGPGNGFDDPDIALATRGLPDGDPHVFPQLRDIRRVNFSPDGSKAYLLNLAGNLVTVVGLDDYRVDSALALDGAYAVIDISPDGDYLVASNLPHTVAAQKYYPNLKICTPHNLFGYPKGVDLCRVGIVNLKNGQSWSFHVGNPVRDVDFLVQTREIIITYGFRENDLESNHAAVRFYDLDAQTAGKKLVFPNCADELNVVPGEDVALLSPTFCASVGADNTGGRWDTKDRQAPVRTDSDQDHSYDFDFELDLPPPPLPPPPPFFDPISVIDLRTRTFDRNLPGFGPVLVTHDGKKALGFTRKKLLEEQWNYNNQTTEYGLVIVDIPTLTWTILDYGNSMPAYFLSPDGKHAALHHYLHRCNCKEIIPWSSSKKGECIGSDYQDCKDSCCEACCTETEESMFYWLDLYTGERQFVGIPLTPAVEYTWTPTGSRLYLRFNSGISVVPLLGEESEPLELKSVPAYMGMRPQGDYLLLGDSKRPQIYLYDLATETEVLKLNMNVMGAMLKNTGIDPDLPTVLSKDPAGYDEAFTLVRLRQAVPTELAVCGPHPGPDIDAVQLLQLDDYGSWETTSASNVAWITDSLDCPSAGHGNPADALGEPDLHAHENGFVAGHLSLNGRQVVLNLGGNAIRSGDTLQIWESMLPGEFPKDPTEAYSVDVGRYVFDTGEVVWENVAQTVSGPAKLPLLF